MPLYRYLCVDCEKEQVMMHSMQQEEVSCTHCGSKNMRKIFKTLSVNNEDYDSPTGDLVKEYIESSKKDLKNHRRELKEREYK